MLENFAVGIDIEENARFENKPFEFFERIFTKREIDYCKNKKNSSSHFCARFCAKEAIVKAFGGLGIYDIVLSDIEILNKEEGVPCAIVEKYPDIEIKISLSHAKTHSIANVLVCKK